MAFMALIGTAGIALATTQITLPFSYLFSITGTLNETDTSILSTSPYWWVDSGGQMTIANGVGSTITGDLPSTNAWNKIYATNFPVATDNGTHPQNVFQMFTNASVQNPSVQIYMNRVRDNLANTANRHTFNGESIIARYKDGNNFYYAGIRADGAVVIKKRLNGVYTTLASKKILAGTYDATLNPDLIPLGNWIGLKFIVTDSSAGPKLSLFTDIGRTGSWSLAISAIDDAVKYGSPIAGPGLVGIKSDYADVQFDDFLLSESGGAVAPAVSPPTPTPTVTTDATAPTTPANLSASAVSTTQINLTWSASSDKVGVTGYRIFRGGSQIASVSGTNYSNSGLTASTAYSYTVKSVDAAGNLSGNSTSASATTQSVITVVVSPPPATTPPPTSTPPTTTTSGSYDSTVMSDSPVMYLPMSSGSSLTEQDQTGHGHNGNYKGGAPTSASLPNADIAADFNGSNQYLSVPSSAALSISTTHSLTWEAWIRPDTLQFTNASGDGYVDWMGKCQDYGPTCEWEARMYSTVTAETRPNRMSAYVFNPSAGLGSAADWQPASSIVQAGHWMHIVAEYTTLSTPTGCNSAYPGQINIWVNGVKQSMPDHMPTGCMSQYKIVPQANSSPLNIGTMAMDTWFKGAVGKVAVYDHLLSQSQINAHFQAMTGKSPTGTCGATCTSISL